jgi:tyrosinase
MQMLDYKNPLSWLYQAAIHGTTLTDNLQFWNTCTHGSFFFWPWHRMYLYWWEKIIRVMADDDTWALPYWNWTSNPTLPAVFRNPDSVLYTPNRAPGWNDGTASFPAQDVDYSSAFSHVAFGLMGDNNPDGATGYIESSPHDVVHGDIGGWMGSKKTSAMDPIFYLHHANMDRLWNLWLAQLGGRVDPLNNTEWTSQKFGFFNESGNQVHTTSCDVLRASQQLGYTYEGEPPQVNEYCFQLVLPYYEICEICLLIHFPPIDLGEETQRVSVGPIEQIFLEAIRNNQDVVLKLNDVFTERQPGATWAVYVNLPSTAEPSPQSPFYVGSIGFFSSGIVSEGHHSEGHPFEPVQFTFNINRAFLASPNAVPLTVTFVATGILINGKPSKPLVRSTVHIGGAQMGILKVTQVPPAPHKAVP